MDTDSSAQQQDQMADMLHFTEKLSPELIAGDVPMVDFSGNAEGMAAAPPPQNPNLFEHSVPFPPSCGAHYHSSTDGNINRKEKETRSSMAVMREMIFRMAAMQPVHIDPESVRPPKRRNVKISRDPQSVAARHRRERISQKIRILQRLVPGGTKMDTASMLDEAIHYVKFLKTQVQSLERTAINRPECGTGGGFPVVLSAGGGGCFPVMKGYNPTVMQAHQHCYAP